MTCKLSSEDFCITGKGKKPTLVGWLVFFFFFFLKLTLNILKQTKAKRTSWGFGRLVAAGEVHGSFRHPGGYWIDTQAAGMLIKHFLSQLRSQDSGRLKSQTKKALGTCCTRPQRAGEFQFHAHAHRFLHLSQKPKAGMTQNTKFCGIHEVLSFCITQVHKLNNYFDFCFFLLDFTTSLHTCA